MSVTILKDTQEALLREFRNILQSEQRTITYEAFPDLFDPFTGEKLSNIPLEGQFYDSSANAISISYPHVFIKLLRSEEDLTSGRIVPPYGKEVHLPIATASRAYNIILGGYDALRTSGNTVTIENLKILLVNAGYILSILSGPNAGNYYILSITLDDNGPHTITLNPKLAFNLPASSYERCSKTLTFLSPVDLNTVAAGDIFTDSSSNTFVISEVDVVNNQIVLASDSPQPVLLSGSFIIREGDILKTTDTNPENFLILDPGSPVVGIGLSIPSLPNTSKMLNIDWAIPLDVIFSITIDTKEFQDHTAVWNRVWEEFNPPRRGLPIIVRTPESAESPLVKDISKLSPNQVEVENASDYIVGETVRIFNGLTTGFETQITGINTDTNTLMLADQVPNTYTRWNNTRIVSNAWPVLWEWDFLSHRENNNDGSHYWSHIYEYRVQVWVNKKYGQEITGVVKQIEGTIEDFNSHVLDSIKVP